MNKEQEPISVKTAAALLEVSEMTVYRMISNRKLSCITRVVNRHRQRFIIIDSMWEKACKKYAPAKKKAKPNHPAKQRSAKAYVDVARNYAELSEIKYRAAQVQCMEASKQCVQAEEHATNAENNEILAKDYAYKAQAACSGAAANAEHAGLHANAAKNASVDAERHCFSAKAFAEDSERHYFSAKACASDAFVQRKEAAESAAEAKREAESAMRCVVWCFCAAVLPLLFAIAHFIL